jgi:glycosyltransferase involved in cell wall biosynthesis
MTEYISILIPLYNGVEFINESVNSVILQTYKKWELIIGINGHEKNSDIENTVNIYIKKVNPNNTYDITVKWYDTKGKSQTLNKMTKDAKYNNISLLDVDDIWCNNKLEKQIPYLNTYDVIGTKCIYFGNLNIIPTIPCGDISNFDIFIKNPLINSCVIIKKEYAEWDETELTGLEDYDLWFKLFKLKKKFYNVSEILCYHRIHTSSCFNNNNNSYLNDLKNKWEKIYYIKN